MESNPHGVRATEPLIPLELRKATAERLQREIQTLLATEAELHHIECWRRYLALHRVPPTWRGRRDIYHYDRMMAGLTVIVRDETPLPRVKLAAFLRNYIKGFENRHIARRDVSEATAWFHGLSVTDRRELAKISRDEESQRKKEQRLIKRLNKRHRDKLDAAFSFGSDPEDAIGD